MIMGTGVRRRRWTALGLLAALIVGIACGDPGGPGGDGGRPGTGGRPGDRGQDQLATSGRDGAFEFTAISMSCGHTALGKERLIQEAQGEFCVVELTVENIGGSPQALELSAQKAFDAEGDAYDAVDTIEIGALNPDAWDRLINPGNWVTGLLVYDVPADTELVRLELHDSDFSHGVDVAIP
jgi:hypothetical protein